MKSYTIAATALCLGMIAVSTGAVAQAKKFAGITLQTNGYGGEWDKLLEEHVAKPLEQKYGLKVVYQPGGSSAAVAKLIASKENPPFDMIMCDSPSMPDLVAAGVLSPLTAKEAPNVAKLLPGAREFGEFGVPYTVSSIVVASNSQQVKTPITSIKDLGRPDLKGRVGLFSMENTGGLLYLLALAKANGGSETNMDPAFKALQGLKGNVATVTGSTVTLNQLFDQEEIWAGTIWNGRAFSMQKQGRPIDVTVPSEGLLSLFSYVSPVKGSKHSEAVQAYLDQLLDDSVTTAFARVFGLAPATNVQLSADIAKSVVAYGPEAASKMKPIDWKIVSAERAGWLERFNKEMR